MPRRSKMKVIGGREYYVIGSTIEWESTMEYEEGFRVVRKCYSTPSGRVIVANGKCYHPDGVIADDLS